MTIADRTTSPPPKLGEELPVFCERCGYSLHGLAQTRCEHCTLLQFHCPECGHRQPINTLRPAAQTILGRIRGGWLVLVVFFKLNLIGWLLFGWAAMGAGWCIEYSAYQRTINGVVRYQAHLSPAHIRWDNVMAFVLFALVFGMVLRMALLRWKRGWAVGVVLGVLAMLAIMIGVWIRTLDFRGGTEPYPFPYNLDFLLLMGLGFLCTILAASLVWSIWTLLVHAFLPTRHAQALLTWQRSLSTDVSALARPVVNLPKSAVQIRDAS